MSTATNMASGRSFVSRTELFVPTVPLDFIISAAIYLFRRYLYKPEIVGCSVESTKKIVETGDPTKKRRVERSRKMAEAKERSSTPAIPSDMPSATKRCELLEKEVRSLKLNLSFMNRKDSEQTKQIEDLQKQNEALTEEKEHLLEEMERILSETGKF